VTFMQADTEVRLPFADAYRGRRVLVTGHRGFKGAWLCHWLGMLGADVRGFGFTAPTTPNLHAEARLAGSVPDYIGDVRDGTALVGALRWAEPELVFHLAAQPLVLRSYREPVETFAINVVGTAQVLHSIASSPSVRSVIVVTSDKCYATGPTGAAHVEADRLGGVDPYSASKAGAELVAACWRQSYWDEGRGPALATARAGNVIGGGDWSEDRIVPDLVRAFGSGQPARLRRPAAVRPWQHVLEPLAGYLTLGARLLDAGSTYAEAWNFGPDPAAARTVAELAREFLLRWAVHGGPPAPPPVAGVNEPPDGPPERATLAIDSSAAHRRLGWRPILRFSEAVDLTAWWYARWASGRSFDARAAMVEQIRTYERLSVERNRTPARVVSGV
jgi:CDP-glucose 4,6-dehydratase